MCADLGLSRGMMTDLKMGRKKSLTAETLTKIAEYFDVTVEYLLGKEEKITANISGDSIDDMPITCIARNGVKMSIDEQKKLLDVAKAMFPGYFNDDKS